QNLGGGNYAIAVAPLSGNAGVYNASVTATDSYGAVTTNNFQILVVENNVSTVFVHFGTDSASVPAPWNNFLGYPFGNRSLNNMLKADGTNSGINLVLVDQWSNAPIDYGMNTGDNSGIFPDRVLRSAYYESTTSPRRIQLTGLDQTKYYNIAVFSSVNGGFQASSMFTVTGGQSFDIDASYNTRKTMQFNGLRPDITGSLTLTMIKDAASNYGGYLNALVIECYDLAVVPVVSPAKVFVEPLFNSRTALSLIWADRASNETGVEVWRSTSANGTFNLVTTLPANSTAYTDQGLTPNTQYFYKLRSVNGGQQSDFSGIASATTPNSIVLEHLTWHFVEGLKPWNNTATNPQVGDIYGNLLDGQLNNTGEALTVINDFNGEASFPVHSTNNSFVFPDSVMSSNYWVDHGQIATMKLYGLDQTKVYRIGYEGATTWQGDMTNTLSINGVTKYLNAFQNTKKVVYFDNVSPNGNGEIYMNFSATGTYGFFGSLVIMGYTPNGTGGGGNGTNSVGPTTALGYTATISQEAIDSANGVMNFRAYPDPFRDGFSISFSNDNGPRKLDIEVYNISGQLVYAQTGAYLSSGVNTIHVNLNQNTQPGLYITRLRTEGKVLKVFKLIKLR
ncbi:MAG TPA: T9SS type A sorting domain-containing protein, partial [Puia sp.]|nr:T9SS type A sorting domain-containing protein [Puia sp.]